MKYTYRIWDKQSTVNGITASKIKSEFGIHQDDQVYILIDSFGADKIVQTQRDAPYPGATIEESAENHIAKILEDNGQ